VTLALQPPWRASDLTTFRSGRQARCEGRGDFASLKISSGTSDRARERDGKWNALENKFSLGEARRPELNEEMSQMKALSV